MRHLAWTRLTAAAILLCFPAVGMAASGALAADGTPAPTAVASQTITFPSGHDSTADLVISPDGKTAYLTPWGRAGKPSTVTIVDVVSGSVRQSDSVGVSTAVPGAAITPDGRKLAVSATKSRSVAILDARSGKVLASIPVGGSPDALFIGPKGSSLFAFLVDQGTIVKIDVRSSRITGRFSTRAAGSSCKKDWAAMAMTPDSKTLLVSCSEHGLLFMNTANGRITRYDPRAGGGTPVFSADRRLVYTGVANFFSITDAKSGASVAQVSLYRKGDGDIDGIEAPLSIAVMPDGAKVYATMPDVGQISVLDASTGRQLSRIEMNGGAALGATALCLSRDARQLYATATDGSILTVDTATDAVVGVDPGPLGSPTGPADSVVSSAPEHLIGSRLGQAWEAVTSGEVTSSGFRVLTVGRP